MTKTAMKVFFLKKKKEEISVEREKKPSKEGKKKKRKRKNNNKLKTLRFTYNLFGVKLTSSCPAFSLSLSHISVCLSLLFTSFLILLYTLFSPKFSALLATQRGIP